MPPERARCRNAAASSFSGDRWRRLRRLGQGVGERPSADEDKGRLSGRRAGLHGAHHGHGDLERQAVYRGSCENSHAGRIGIHRRGGKSAQVKTKLSRKALRLLKRRKRISAKVKINVTRAGKSTTRTVKVTLKAPGRDS